MAATWETEKDTVGGVEKKRRLEWHVKLANLSMDTNDSDPLGFVD